MARWDRWDWSLANTAVSITFPAFPVRYQLFSVTILSGE